MTEKDKKLVCSHCGCSVTAGDNGTCELCWFAAKDDSKESKEYQARCAVTKATK